MKLKKFRFEHSVVTIVETKYSYKVEAKTYEQAESKLKESFDRKISNGSLLNPIKKFLNKVNVVESTLIDPEIAGNETVKVEYIPKKKSGLSSVNLYNNIDNTWKPFKSEVEEISVIEDDIIDNVQEEEKE
jgi:hypothetical protein